MFVVVIVVVAAAPIRLSTCATFSFWPKKLPAVVEVVGVVTLLDVLVLLLPVSMDAPAALLLLLLPVDNMSVLIDDLSSLSGATTDVETAALQEEGPVVGAGVDITVAICAAIAAA